MDQKTTNRLLLSIIGVPLILFVLYILLIYLIRFIFMILYGRLGLTINFYFIFYVKWAILVGAAVWIIIFAYAYVRTGEFKLSKLKIGKE